MVDDERALRDMLETGLRQAGFSTRGLADGRSAPATVRDYAPDLILLDVMLPGVDGFALLEPLRSETDAPIIMLSACARTEEKVRGLTSGADDYVAKPFELSELVARVRTALRRPRLGRDDVLRYADLSLHARARAVFRGERRVDLTTREYDLLSALMRRPETVMTRAELLDLVWGRDHDVFPNTLETYVSYLRAKIDSGEPVKLIRTLRGRGYALGEPR